jgi:lipoprotein-releasing system ATP-binding protein
MPVVLKKVTKSFGPTTVLHGIDLVIPDGSFASITGRSGSGKSTLLYIMSTLDAPTTGDVTLNDNNPALMSDEELHRFRNSSIGFIFQFHYLLPELTAEENIYLPAIQRGYREADSKRAKELLGEFGMAEKFYRYPNQLSGGEQQRVAIARALMMKPKFIFADEPTGNLDSHNGIMVMNLLKKINKELKTSIILVTHEPDYAAMATQQIQMVDGKLA